MSFNQAEWQQRQNDKHAGADAATTVQQYSGPMAQAYALEERVEAPDVAQFIQQADIQEGQSVLDLGCGLGWVTVAALAKTEEGRVVGVDCSPHMLGAFRDHLEADGIPYRLELGSNDAPAMPTVEGMPPPRIELVREDVLHLPTMQRFLPSSSFPGFDAILCRRVLSGLPSHQQEGALRLWAECLAPHGRLVVEQVHEFRYIGAVTTVDRHGVPGWQARIAPLAIWKEARAHLNGQVANAGLKAISFRRTQDDLPDRSIELTERARAAWAATGRPGDMNRQFAENQRRLWFEETRAKEAASEVRLTPVLVSVVAVVVRR